MESYEVLSKAMTEIGVKTVAAKLGLSTSLLYKWGQKPARRDVGDESGARNPPDRVLQIYRISGKREIIEWLYLQAEGLFVDDPHIEKSDDVDQSFLAGTRAILGLPDSCFQRSYRAAALNDGLRDCASTGQSRASKRRTL